MSNKTITLHYKGKSKRAFGVTVLNTTYRFNPADKTPLELSEAEATTLLSLDPKNWRETEKPAVEKAASPVSESRKAQIISKPDVPLSENKD